MAASKPHVLIFGGVNHLTPALVQYLVPPSPAEPLVASVRIFDKYTVIPATTYIGKPFKTLLEERKDIIEYRQVNLTVPSVVSHCLSEAPPAAFPGASYTQIFDLSGDTTFDRPSGVHIQSSFRIPLSIATTAKATLGDKLKAYVRLLHPYYEHNDAEKKNYKEEDESGWKVSGARGVWWHEMARAVGSIPGLPLVIIRVPYYYGPNILVSEITTHILMGYVYKQLKEEMKFLWSPKLKRNSIHTEDAAGALWAAASWISTMDRANADKIAGVPLPPSGDKEVPTVAEAIQKDVKAVVVPVFHIVDDTDTTQETLAQAVSQVFGIQYTFSSALQNQLAKFKMAEVAEDINEHHMEAWTQILMASNVQSTALTPYAHVHQLEKHGYGADGSKIKKVLNYQLKKPIFDAAAVKEVIQSFRAEGTWPETPLYQG